MPSSFTLTSDKTSEVVISSQTVSNGSTGTITTVVTGNVLSSSSGSNKEIGKYIVTKVTSLDTAGNIWSDFNYTFQITNSSNGIYPTGSINFVLHYYNQTNYASNPTETIPSGGSASFTNGLLSAVSTGQYCNQFGYVVKTKNSTNIRSFSFTYPQLIAGYSTAFDNSPQPSVAPLA